MRRMMFPGRRDKRRAEAIERLAVSSSLTLEQRLALCDDRPGACLRERTRLLDAIRLRDVPKPAEAKKEPPKQDKKATKAHKRKEEQASS